MKAKLKLAITLSVVSPEFELKLTHPEKTIK